MAKRLTITSIRESSDVLWYYQTNPSENFELKEWIQNNSNRVTFDVEILQSENYPNTQILEYTFADEATADEFLTIVSSSNLGSTMENYNASVGITTTHTITDV